MEKRIANVIIHVPGGTASRTSKTYKVSLPTAWMNEMGVTPDNKQVELQFDGEQIIIRKSESAVAFAERKKQLKHDVRVVRYYNKSRLCSVIYADFSDNTLRVENHTDNLVKTAFGKQQSPSWEDFLQFLEERCLPRGRAGLREYLETIGLDQYDPIEIIQKTAGKMAEDQQWMEMERL